MLMGSKIRANQYEIGEGKSWQGWRRTNKKKVVLNGKIGIASGKWMSFHTHTHIYTYTYTRLREGHTITNAFGADGTDFCHSEKHFMCRTCVV